MSKLNDILTSELKKFKDEYPRIKTDDTLQLRVTEFISNKDLIIYLEDIQPLIIDPDYISKIEDRMSECNYKYFKWLCNDALNDLIWDHIVSNYELYDISELVNDIKEFYNENKNDPVWYDEENGYIRVFYDQLWIPDIFDDVDEELQKVNLWLETGEGDPTDIYICSNKE